MRGFLLRLSVLILAIFWASPSHALITGDKGNKPIRDPGWPAGAEAVFNTKSRIAWWEGPPLGGGQWHSECQGNTTAFNEVLEAFQKIDAPHKRLVVRDGVGASFWLDPNGEHKGDPSVEMDWVFIIWQSNRLEMQKKMPAGLSALRHRNESTSPEIQLFVGGAIAWKDVIVPKGVEVVDQRLEAHGFSKSDGRVLLGKVTDSASGKPLLSTIRMESIEPKKSGGYEHREVASVETNEDGEWVFKNVGQQWCQIVAEADGYLPRLITNIRYDDQPGWERADTQLTKQSSIQGRIVDEQNMPIANVSVRLSDLAVENQLAYRTRDNEGVLTDKNGVFDIPAIEGGLCRVWIHKDGFVRAGLGENVIAPARDVLLTMTKSASLTVSVQFKANNRKGDYMIHIAPEGGEKVGSWGGSGSIDAENKIVFQHIPPGKYLLFGRPNPGSDNEKTKEKLVEMEAGKSIEIELDAK